MKAKTGHTSGKQGDATPKAAALYPLGISEEELKNKVAADWFPDFDTTRIVGSIDFCVAAPSTPLAIADTESILWAEAKKGNKASIRESLVQLILTLGKERTFDRILPPKFLGAFDAEKIAFVPYHEVMDVFDKNDFNWNVAPSNHETKEFKELDALIGEKLEAGSTPFSWARDGDDLRDFIKANFRIGDGGVSQIQITRNNFTHIYGKWRETVMPTIEMPDWGVAKKAGIIDADFFLADILSQGNVGLSRKLNILLKIDHYHQAVGVSSIGLPLFQDIRFKDGQKAHRQFWSRYKRPPRAEYREYIINRRDLLVPQDVRERKGSFFTPKRWVELSQHYLELELGEGWQDECYIWDCCAGTGNLLAGLTNKYRVWASTLDQQDVAVMKQRILNGANLLDSHVFQFDFLNDPLGSEKIPEDLRDVLTDAKKRKRLVIYINPPYAEAGSTFAKKSKVGVSNQSNVHRNYAEECGKFAKRELFVQFLMRIYKDIPGCIIGQFSTLKHLQGPYFKDFRKAFCAQLKRSFIVPADTFDNVKGQFPIGFFIWSLSDAQHFVETKSDIYVPLKAGYHLIGEKYISSYENSHPLNDWLRETWKNAKDIIGFLACNGNDFQHQNEIAILSAKNNETSTFFKPITKANVVKSCVYLAVRHAIDADWLNDRDQFLYPKGTCVGDSAFLSDCITFALFHGQNRIMSSVAINHWIPFTEQEVNAQGLFKSHFMSDFLAGKVEAEGSIQDDLFGAAETARPAVAPYHLSPEAQAVMDAGRELWRYYHEQEGANPNASFYDIRLHFQGTTKDAKGKERMNSDSPDAKYTELLAALRAAMKRLARHIEPKVYEYGFLKK